MTDVTPQMVLDLPLPENGSGASTVRGYLIALLAELWREESGFNSKRPFGMSGWQYDLYVPLAKAGYITGMTFDEDGYAAQSDLSAMRAADELILGAIASMGGTP